MKFIDSLLRLRSILHPIKLHICRWHPEREELFRVTNVIRECNAQSILDVGGNVGQFALGIINSNYAGIIYSFEPQSVAYKKLVQTAKPYKKWIIPERCAIGNINGVTKINIAHNSVSSSILEVASACVDAAPNSITIGQEDVIIQRLDEWISKNSVSGNIFVKIDTQGFEMNVLQGCNAIFDRIVGFYIETSLIPLYTSQPLIYDIIEYLNKNEFIVVDIIPGFQDPKSGKLLQVDLLARRK